MLADDGHGQIVQGGLAGGVQRPKAWLLSLMDFIAEQLPIWRDRPDRPQRDAETPLTSQLCGHLNSAAQKSVGWDILQFRVEEPDEHRAGRRLDLVAAPSGGVIWIEGRSYGDFDTLLPVECKRLPTPTRSREKREYLRTADSTTGGVQRFKAGDHGAKHTLGAMIGYVQADGIEVWVARVDRWVRALARAAIANWHVDDRFVLEWHDREARVAVLSSRHRREQGLPEIALRHIWIEV